MAIVAENREVLEKLARKLLSDESLDREQFENFLSAYQLKLPDGSCTEMGTQ
jgi:ATP-dependent Zn protease